MTSELVHAFSTVAISEQWIGTSCVYCDQPMETLREDRAASGYLEWRNQWLQRQCKTCHWWCLEHYAQLLHEDGVAYRQGASYALLNRFPVGSADVPITELRRHLAKKFDSRFDIHPRKLEELLASVFREHGFRVELTSYTKDD